MNTRPIKRDRIGSIFAGAVCVLIILTGLAALLDYRIKHMTVPCDKLSAIPYLRCAK